MAENKDFKYLVRVMNTDLDGKKHIYVSMRKIKGVSYALSNAVCKIAGVNPRKKTGELSDSEAKRIDDILKNPLSYNIPLWMVNRRNDPETGVASHLCTSNLQFANENDIKTMKKVKSYKGLRHAWGLPVRGQRTKSNFRRTKSKGKTPLGVKREKPGKK